MNYPQTGTLRDFLRLLAMVIHAMATISTNANSCLGQISKLVLILRINFPHTRRTGKDIRWTFLLTILIYCSICTKWFAKHVKYHDWVQPHNIRPENYTPKISFCAKNEDNLIFICSEMQCRTSRRGQASNKKA